MKKILFALIQSISFYSTQAQLNNVAIISFSTYYGLRTENFTDVTINSMPDIYLGKDFNINDEMNKFKTFLFEDLSKEFPRVIYASPLNVNMEPTRKSVRDPNLLDKKVTGEIIFTSRSI